jgi:methanogenic corrinoid protein MtbC1
MPDGLPAYLDALLGGRRVECMAIVERALAANARLRDVYLGLFQPALYSVGDLWERNRVTVATEHLATSIVETQMSLLEAGLFDAPHKNATAVVACSANEHHQIGGRMIADAFEWNGWHADFLGANTPEDALLAYLADRTPNVVALSLSVAFNIDRLLHTVEAIRIRFPSLPILVGGQAFRWGRCAAVEAVPGVTVLAGLDEFERRLPEWEPHG